MFQLFQLVQAYALDPEGVSLTKLAYSMYGENDEWAIEKTRGLIARMRRDFRVAFFAGRIRANGKTEWRYKVMSSPEELEGVRDRLIKMEEGIEKTIEFVRQKEKEAKAIFGRNKVAVEAEK